MGDLKKAHREAEETAKETWRKADGEESPSDKIANVGDDVRKHAGNAGDDLRERIDEATEDLDDERRNEPTTERGY
jgi:gas vesicle protein